MFDRCTRCGVPYDADATHTSNNRGHCRACEVETNCADSLSDHIRRVGVQLDKLDERVRELEERLQPIYQYVNWLMDHTPGAWTQQR
jgi:hypothetical protein